MEKMDVGRTKRARTKEVTGVKFEPIDCQRLRAGLRLIFQTYAA
jgi:hypothetical protein